MKKLLILSAFLASVNMVKAGNIRPVKPGPKARYTISVIKLVEAKALLSKANTKNLRSNLDIAHGRI